MASWALSRSIRMFSMNVSTARRMPMASAPAAITTAAGVMWVKAATTRIARATAMKTKGRTMI